MLPEVSRVSHLFDADDSPLQRDLPPIGEHQPPLRVRGLPICALPRKSRPDHRESGCGQLFHELSHGKTVAGWSFHVPAAFRCPPERKVTTWGTDVRGREDLSRPSTDRLRFNSWPFGQLLVHRSGIERRRECATVSLIGGPRLDPKNGRSISSDLFSGSGSLDLPIGLRRAPGCRAVGSAWRLKVHSPPREAAESEEAAMKPSQPSEGALEFRRRRAQRSEGQPISRSGRRDDSIRPT